MQEQQHYMGHLGMESITVARDVDFHSSDSEQYYNGPPIDPVRSDRLLTEVSKLPPMDSFSCCEQDLYSMADLSEDSLPNSPESSESDDKREWKKYNKPQ